MSQGTDLHHVSVMSAWEKEGAVPRSRESPAASLPRTPEQHVKASDGKAQLATSAPVNVEMTEPKRLMGSLSKAS